MAFHTYIFNRGYEMPWSSKEKSKEWHKQYYSNNRTKKLEQSKKYYREHKEEAIERARKKNNEMTPEGKKYGSIQYKKSIEKLRNLFFEMYGGKCACCGEMNKSFLTLDHVNNDGAKQRVTKTGKKSLGRNTTEYRKAVKNYSPEVYQILCYNCNCGKNTHGGICPHKMEKENL